ncbi:MAG: U32 family peptidase [Chitinispirillales bacterium]|nr:U32 family peptidase [Chitinispirillales bacterium]
MGHSVSQIKKPELLAPAGSIESFYAAIEAGADAVYLGTSDFNARLRAKNFTIRTLSTLIPYAHSRSVKVYVTINTMIKQQEIEQALNLLYQLEQLRADAIIAADIGLMRLAATHFPKLNIHASTQAAVHNSCGTDFLKTLGVKRVVLARELSVDEIRETARKSPIELEVFIHGALCYSISGLCLASSFIGGASGNRGRCTQVCRRRFNLQYIDNNAQATDKNGGYYFSPFDLQGIYSAAKLAKAGVSSFKIEGRMKPAEYVDKVVRAYRHVIDFPGEASSAAQKLTYDFGRPKTSFFLDGRKGNYIDPFYPAGTGIFLGSIIKHDNDSLTLSNNINTPVDTGDRLRVQPQNGFEGAIFKVDVCVKLDDTLSIKPRSAVECGIGDNVFLIGKATLNHSYNETTKTAAAQTVKNLRMIFPNAKKIAGNLSSIQSVNNKNNHSPKAWLRADSLKWLEILDPSACKYLVFDADLKELESLITTPKILKTWRSRLFIALAPFIEETRLEIWRNIVEKCISAGLRSFALSNAGHFVLVKGAKNLMVQAPLWSLNRFTQKELEKSGVHWFEYSPEDDFMNIRAAASPKGVVTLYSKPPLFISRVPPPVVKNAVFTDPHKNSFFTKVKNSLCYTLPQTPVCLFAKREKLMNCGIENFLIDLNFHEPNHNFFEKTISSFKSNIKIEESTLFNFKLGLK